MRDMGYSYEYFKKSADYIKGRLGEFEPDVGIVLGSGLGEFAKRIENPVTIDYKDIPNFLVSTVSDHAGKFIFGTVAGKKLACMSGRFHSYEGYEYEQLVIPVRVMKLIGIKTLILTNAAGGVNLEYRPGDIMLIKDHIKFMGHSPMRGPNIEEFGPRFFDVGNMYDRNLREIAWRCGGETPLRIFEGNYFFCSGPNFETPAEIEAIRILGGDAVGMSTVTEALTAAHCGIPVLGISLITNLAAGMGLEPLSGEDVTMTAQSVEVEFSKYFTKVIGMLP